MFKQIWKPICRWWFWNDWYSDLILALSENVDDEWNWDPQNTTWYLHRDISTHSKYITSIPTNILTAYYCTVMPSITMATDNLHLLFAIFHWFVKVSQIKENWWLMMSITLPIHFKAKPKPYTCTHWTYNQVSPCLNRTIFILSSHNPLSITHPCINLIHMIMFN